MSLNVGCIDRVLRAILVLALIAFAFLGGLAPWGYMALLSAAAGVILVATAFMSWCPIYAVLGLGMRKA